ncbi:MAG: hypothetical protein RLZ98_1215 [Pseudomonadota bacterium]|jgi:hypothetical protein
MNILLAIILLAHWPTFIFYGLLAIGSIFLLWSWLRRSETFRSTGIVLVSVPVAGYVLVSVLAEIRPWLIHPEGSGGMKPERLIVENANLNDETASILLASGGLNSIVVKDRNTYYEIVFLDREQCANLVRSAHEVKDGRLRLVYSNSLHRSGFIKLHFSDLKQCMSRFPLEARDVARYLASEMNLVLLMGRQVTVGRWLDGIIHHSATADSQRELRLRGRGLDRLVRYWERQTIRPCFPPIISFLGVLACQTHRWNKWLTLHEFILPHIKAEWPQVALR